MRTYQRVPVSEVCIDDLLGNEPSSDFTEQMESKVSVDLFISKLPPTAAKVCELVVEGYSFAKAMEKLNISKVETYEIRRYIKSLLIKNNPEAFARLMKKNEGNLKILFDLVARYGDKIPLTRFDELYIKPYDGEDEMKHWVKVPLQDEYEKIWDTNQKSCTLAPREHLKTTTVIKYLIKKIFNRKFPIEINYYHFNIDIAREKFQKFKRFIQMSPLLSANFKIKDSSAWNEDRIELTDGTVIAPMSYRSGNIGKHPHIIVLDDVIDKSVMYSDDLNKKLNDNFYMNIYPQMSKVDADKKLIIIGTAQRKDDLYHSLPSDIPLKVFGAYTDEECTKPLSPELFSVADLKKIESDISSKHGNKFWLKEYMNKPFEAIGFIIKGEQIQYYDNAPAGLQIYQGWDLSVGKNIEKGDYTVGATVGIDFLGDKIKIYLLDLFRARVNFDQRLKAVVEYANRWKPLAIGIESNAFQYDTVQQLKDKTLFPIFGMKSIINKVESFQVELAPYFENKQIFIPKGMAELESELLSLPVSTYDDQADAIKFAIKVALQYKESAPMIGFA